MPFLGVLPAFASGETVTVIQPGGYSGNGYTELDFTPNLDISGYRCTNFTDYVLWDTADNATTNNGYATCHIVGTTIKLEFLQPQDFTGTPPQWNIYYFDHNQAAHFHTANFTNPLMVTPTPTPTAAPTPTPTSTVPSLDPAKKASISAATGSIASTASSFVLSSFLHVLPYILLVVGLFLSYKLIRKWMGRQQGLDNGWIDTDGQITDPEIFDQMQGDKVGQADIWQSDFDENGKIDPKAYAQHWENNLADVKVFNPEAPAEPSDWMESAGGVEQHMADQGIDDTFYGEESDK